MGNNFKPAVTAARIAWLAVAAAMAFGLHASAASPKDSTERNPAETSAPLSVSAADRKSVFLDDEGEVWYWGARYTLVDGEEEIATVPVRIDMFEDAVFAQAGYVSNLVVKEDGTVWQWGFEFQTADGLNGTTSLQKPRKIEGLERIVKAYPSTSLGGAIDEDGAVWVWHIVPSGPDLVTTKPMKLKDIEAKEISVSGAVHILKPDGTVWRWHAYIGDNGNGSYAKPNTNPTVTQVHGLSDIAAIFRGNNTDNYFAITKDGDVYGWGQNRFGNLGFSDYNPVYSPKKIPSLSKVASIAASGSSTLFVKTDGTVWRLGQKIGMHLPISYTAEPEKVEGLSDIASVALGEDHAVAVTRSGVIYNWGHSGYFTRDTPYRIRLAEEGTE